ncbi:lamin tail domain-containing protein [Pseudomarimonas salicorniae]|uniref:Lamin tail domain-containing protein n=1 Tax=Pseudomarimonas salicorniae TaxID=2933270 RepID=A0ABT0GDV9_9GAMM|nr:lamin tail domain-containing protein [Lysobacter sp. CAU 1642]MCK7592200.1 lamin tail domain-containing protein [Lysobacter sp. CAU 1642]
MFKLRSRRAAARAALCLFVLIFCCGQAAAAGRLVISQVYGGGGNSGATFTHDFVELFNAGDAAVSVDGWSVQYASSSGTSWQSTALSGSVLPGQYYLVQQARGSGGSVALPDPDASGSIAMSASSGKVALVAATAALSGACPLADAVDFVGFGSANCFAGSAAAPGLGNTTAALRGEAGCLLGGDNAADFSRGTPAPRNSAAALAPCAGGPGAAQLSISDLSLAEGNSGITPFGFEISLGEPAANDVVFDVVTLDGSASAAEGDYVPVSLIAARIPAGETRYRLVVEVLGDTAFEADETFVVRLINVVGAQTLRGEALGTIQNDDPQPLPLLPIPVIQGAGIGDSPWLGQRVAVEGVITARRGNGYFIQSAVDDGDPTTAEGLFVFTGSALPAEAEVGTRARVEGEVSQFRFSPHGYAVTQLSRSQLIVQATRQPLPASVELTAADLSPTAPISRLGRYQSMRVHLPQAQTIGGSNSFGDFFVKLPEVARPAREPGIALLDAVPLPAEITPPRFDMNPERLRVVSVVAPGDAPLFVDSLADIAGLEGVLYYDRAEFSLLLDASAPVAVNGGIAPRPAPAAPFDALTIGSYNIENFNAASSNAGPRLQKLSQVFCGFLGTPDIVGLVEIANLESVQALATAINDNQYGHCPDNPRYQAFLLSNAGSQRLAFLVSTREVLPGVPRVAVNEVIEEGLGDSLVAPDGSISGVLFDRPPLRLSATVSEDNGQQVDVTVIGNHLLSLLNVVDLSPRNDSWGTGGERSRGKRLQQAVRLAQIVDARQRSNPEEKIVLLGDFNAFEFNDGYVDVMGIISGRPAAANEVLAYAPSPLVTPLFNLAATVPAEDRYSYVFAGNTQALDHILINAPLQQQSTPQLHYVRVNSDFGYDNAADVSIPVRSSDHDPLVAHLRLPEFAYADVDLSVRIDGPRTPLVNGAAGEFRIAVGNGGAHRARDAVLSVELTTPAERVQLVDAAGWSCAVQAQGALRSTLECLRSSPFEAGASETLMLRASMPRVAPQTFLVLQGRIDSSGSERSPQDNTDSFSVRVTGKPGG